MTSMTPITPSDAMSAQAVVTAHAPSITVVAPQNYPNCDTETREHLDRFTRTAVEMLTDLGARPKIVDPTDESPANLDAEFDGLLLLGGGDVDPHLYGYFDDVPNLSGVDRRCDERTLGLIAAARDAQRPMLGICRGAQIINVAYGGTLIPDLGPDNRHRGRGGSPIMVDDSVEIESGTRLAGILQRRTAAVRNGHHQAVRDVAPQMRVAARGIDGVIQAIEHRESAHWVVGVQWHPEDTAGSRIDGQRLFSDFLAKCKPHRR